MMRYGLGRNGTDCKVRYQDIEPLRECSSSEIVEVETHGTRLEQQRFLGDVDTDADVVCLQF
jgi:hypothetical protein